MNIQTRSLRRAFEEADETADRCHLTQAVVNDASVRSLVYDLARFHGFPGTQSPSKASLEYLLAHIVCRLREAEDPVVERLSEASSDTRFQFAPGELVRDVT